MSVKVDLKRATNPLVKVQRLRYNSLPEET